MLCCWYGRMISYQCHVYSTVPTRTPNEMALNEHSSRSKAETASCLRILSMQWLQCIFSDLCFAVLCCSVLLCSRVVSCDVTRSDLMCYEIIWCDESWCYSVAVAVVWCRSQGAVAYCESNHIFYSAQLILSPLSPSPMLFHTLPVLLDPWFTVILCLLKWVVLVLL